MNNNEKAPSEAYDFVPSEVVGDDLNLLEYQIPYSQPAKLAGFVLDKVRESDV